LKIDETDFHIPTATTTTEQSFHSKPEKPVQTNGAAADIQTTPLRQIKLILVQEGRKGFDVITSYRCTRRWTWCTREL
jgi:hypothetical protein